MKEKRPRGQSADEKASTIEALPVYEPTSPEQARPAIQSDSPPAFEEIDQIIPTNDDGRIDLVIGEEVCRQFTMDLPPEKTQPAEDTCLAPTSVQSPIMNVLMLVVGSRGDVQPFIAIGQRMQQDGHRVRLATHPHFRSFVEAHGLEFFSIGGDPSELMAYMVQNPGLVPKFAALRQGEVAKRRRSMRDMIYASWRACFEPGHAPREKSIRSSSGKESKARVTQSDPRPFVADFVVANPPSLAHIHCAERLGIPLHILFTMPWLPTQAFSHPLANIKTSNKNLKQVNYLSYLLIESVIWQGLGSIINRFRHNVLELSIIHPSRAPAIISGLRIPHTFCWSPSLLPKPKDWGDHVAVPGYLFQDDKALYEPPAALQGFLKAGTPPVYIGFGSIVVEDSAALTNIVIEAVQQVSYRAIIHGGWSGLGQPNNSLAPSTPNIFVLQADCPHDWLFPQVSCVVHHGGAGTTAAGLRAGRPTVVVPFFGDQFFWSDMVFQTGAGPRPIPYRSLNAPALAEAIEAASESGMKTAASTLGQQIGGEDGVEAALQHMYTQLPIEAMTCALLPSYVATWKSKSTGVRMSACAATVLRKEKVLDFKDLSLYRPVEHNVSRGPFEPVSGAMWAVTELIYDSFRGMGEILVEVGHVPVVGHRFASKMLNKSDAKKSAELDPDDERLSTYRVAMTDNIFVQQTSSESTDSKDHKYLGEYFFDGTARIVKAAARAPGTFAAGMAQGAHNMPRMWGDATVRPAAEVTGIGSGVAEGCKQLALGVYDGISGLFVQPIKGAIDEGPVGFVKGAGRGVLSLPVKFFAAAAGTAGYPLKGVDMAISHAFKNDGTKVLRNQRMLQGEHEYFELSDEAKNDIIQRWHDLLARRKILKDQGVRPGQN